MFTDLRAMSGAVMKRKALWGKGALFGLLAALCGQAAAQELDIRDYEAPDACDADKPQLQVTVRGLDDSGGILAIELYRNDDANFLKKKARLRRVRVPADVFEEGYGSQTICMDAPEPGLYAMATYHDQDGDRDLDKRWNMMPKEPFALSNNPKLKWGFPPIGPSLFPVSKHGAVVTLVLMEAR